MDAEESWVLETNETGRVTRVSSPAAEMFKSTASGLRGRDLLLYFPGMREHLAAAVWDAASGISHGSVLVTLFPADAKPRQVVVTLTTASTGTVAWLVSLIATLPV